MTAGPNCSIALLSSLSFSNARDQLQARLEALEDAKSVADRESSARIAALEQQVAELSSNLVQRESEGANFTSRLLRLE